LFARHLNATPTQVAKTVRVQRAKRLLDVTDLPMTELALQAGFRSLRRFNAVFVEVYKKSPTKIRLFARANGWGPQVVFARHKPALVADHAVGSDEVID
jgi:AraC family transcriptional regulator of adaptative response / DNA-3-methyladenine glycosylase II